jgi:hypothetical protein
MYLRRVVESGEEVVPESTGEFGTGCEEGVGPGTRDQKV